MLAVNASTRLALSPDGKQVAYQLMTNTDWEIYVSPTAPAAASAAPAAGAGAGGGAASVASGAAAAHRRLTRDIQHDLLPRFLNSSTLIGLKGEARHRPSYLYDLATGASTRLFSNNSIRTISPEYVWIPSADGRFLILQAERDGDTVSTERDISVVDLTRKISMADLQARLDKQFAVESDLRQRDGRHTSRWTPPSVSARDDPPSTTCTMMRKVALRFRLEITSQPGNLKAIQYLEKTYPDRSATTRRCSGSRPSALRSQ